MRFVAVSLKALVLGWALTGCAAGGGTAMPATSPQPATSAPVAASRFEARIDFSIDRSAATENGLSAGAIDDLVNRFLQSHDTFSLVDLQNLRIPSESGRDVLLQEVASVQVEFHRTGK